MNFYNFQESTRMHVCMQQNHYSFGSLTLGSQHKLSRSFYELNLKKKQYLRVRASIRVFKEKCIKTKQGSLMK